MEGVSGRNVPTDLVELAGARAAAAYRYIEDDLRCYQPADTSLAFQKCRTLLTNPTTTDIMMQQILAKADNEVKCNAQKPQIVLREKLNDAEHRLVTHMFPDYNIDVTTAFDNVGHYFARALRKITERFILDKLGYSIKKVPVYGYDAVLKDIGGNPWRNIVRDRVNVHTCAPILDIKDAMRYSNYMRNITECMDDNLQVTKRNLCGMHIRRDPRVICHNVAQLCHVKTPRAMFLHSAYDMSIYEMAESMVAGGVKYAMGAMHYNPVVHMKEKGEFPSIHMFYKKYIAAGRKRIRFWFLDDTQLTYDHDYEVYISHIKAFRISVETVNGLRYYYYNILFYGCDTIIFELSEFCNTIVPGGLVTRVITDNSMVDKVLISYHKWLTEPCTVMFPSKNHLKKDVLVVPVRLFEMLMSYAATLPQSKFLTKNIQTAAHTMNTRQIVNGTSVVAVDRITAGDCDILAHIVFVVQYIRNFENTKMVQSYIEQEEFIRKYSDSCLLSRFFMNFCKEKYEFKETDVMDVYEERKRTALASIFKIERRREIFFSEMFPKFYTFDEYLDDIQTTLTSMHRGADTIRFYEDDGTNDLVEKDMPLVGFSPTICDGEFEVIQNVSSGHCMLQSCVDHGIVSSIDEGRRIVYEAMTKFRVADQDMVGEYLRCDSDVISEDLWPPSELLVLFAYGRGIRVCVHTVDGCVAAGVGEGTTFHFRLIGGHCQALRELLTLPRILELNITDEKCDKEKGSLCKRKQYYERVFGVMRKSVKAKVFKERYYISKKCVDPYSDLEKCGYECHAALKTAEILSRYFKKNSLECALSFGGPGGEVQVLHDTTPAFVYGITLLDSLTPFVAKFDEVRFKSLFGFDGSGDVLVPQNQEDFVDEIKSDPVHHTIDFFGADLASQKDDCDIDLDSHYKLLDAQWTIVKRVLRVGGGGYFKIFGVSHEPTLRLVLEWCRFFHSVKFVKLITSAPVSTEYHVILRNYVGSFEKVVQPEYLGNAINNAQLRIDRANIEAMSKVLACFQAAGSRRVPSVVAEDLEMVRKVLGTRPTGNRCGGNVIRVPVQKIKLCHDSDADYVTARHSVATLSRDLELDSRDVCVSESICDDVKEEQYAVIADVVKTRNIFSKMGKGFCRWVTGKSKYDNNYYHPRNKTFNCPVRTVARIDENEMCNILPQNNNERYTIIREREVAREFEKDDVSVRSETGKEDIYSVPDYMMPTFRFEKKSCDSADTKEKKAIWEFFQMQKIIVASEVSNLRRFRDKVLNMPNASEVVTKFDDSYGVIDRKTLTFAVGFEPRKKFKNYSKVFANDKLVSWTDFKSNLNDYKDPVIVSEYCVYAYEQEIITNIEDEEPYKKFELPKTVSFVQAGPGCGKTTDILNKHVFDEDIVLLSTQEGRDDFRARVRNKFGERCDKILLKTRYRTLMSVLINKSVVSCDTLYVDEALMHHPGAIFVAVHYTRCVKLALYGDRLQIPFVHKAPFWDVEYSDLNEFVDVTNTLYVSHRIPCDIAYRFDKDYIKFNERFGISQGLMTTSKVVTSASMVRISTLAEVPIKEGVQYLTYTQSEKETLLNGGYKPVSTVHEFQGKEADEVIVVRLRPYPQEEIYLRHAYALVALTRHKKNLIYYTVYTNDELSKLIQVDNIRVFSVAPQDEILKRRFVGVGGLMGLELRIARIVRYEDVRKDAVWLFPISEYSKARAKCRHVMIPTEAFQKIHVLDEVLNILRKDLVYVVRACDVKMSLNVFAARFYKYMEKKDCLCVVAKNFIKMIEPQIFDLVNVNAYLMREFNVEAESVECASNDHVVAVPQSCEVNVVALQHFMDEVFSFTSFVDQTYDDVLIELGGLDLCVTDVSFSPIRGLWGHKNFDCLTPVLKTVVPETRNYTRNESLLALLKRNKNVPNMEGVVNVSYQASNMFEKFLRTYVDDCRYNVIDITMEDIQLWLDKQNLSNMDLIVPEFPLEMTPLNEYYFSIKNKPKPNLTIDAVYNYSALQTILYHPKYVNAIFCVLFKKIRDNVMNSLRRNVIIYTDMSLEDFQNRLNQVPDQFMLFAGDDSLLYDGVDYFEVDLSKYDKSQGALALEYECIWMEYFGAPKFLIELWYNAHVLTRFRDPKTSLSGVIPFQRKSGDASTFFGNTMYLMGVLADVLNLSDISCGQLGKMAKTPDVSNKLALIYNLEAKINVYTYPYFCSKFLIRLSDRWVVFPDPVKLVVKLGRRDVVNEDHLRCLIPSIYDHVKMYDDLVACSVLARALQERYNVRQDYTFFLHSLSQLHMIVLDLFQKLPESNIDESRHVFIDK